MDVLLGSISAVSVTDVCPSVESRFDLLAQQHNQNITHSESPDLMRNLAGGCSYYC